MSIDLTQQALNALADAGLGNDTPAEAYVIGYTQGHNDALALAVGYWLGEQDVQTVTQEVRQTGDVKRLCMTVKTGERIDAMSCELIDPLSGGVK